MGTGTITKYSASAGSGKTFELTARYLQKLFTSQGQAYKRILAVTFTNKAAAEMKYKIIDHLFRISKGEETSMLKRLEKDTGLSPEELEDKSKQLLRAILHDYSFFNVGTIDSFFQRILRAFAREFGLQYSYLIELDHKYLLARAIDDTVENAATDAELLKWLTTLGLEKTEEGKSWNIKWHIEDIAGEIFREKFRLIPENERKKLEDKQLLENYIKNLQGFQQKILDEIKKRARECRDFLDRHHVTDDMFYYGTSGGVGSFINKMLSIKNEYYPEPGARVMKVKENHPVWSSKNGPTPQLEAARKNEFENLFLEMLDFYLDNYKIVNTAKLITEYAYILGIFSDILKSFRNITTTENRFLLSDTGELLLKLIGGDQTPFIYEKAGNTYENFMIDEFQDTSVIQWNNFLPLIENSIAGGFENLVVGDVKQSIYRWRNSDWRIMSEYLEKQIDKSRIIPESLGSNYRSLRNIVAFNNSLFSVLPSLLDKSPDFSGVNMKISSIYSDVKQSCPENREGGYVRVEFIDNNDGAYKEAVLERLPEVIEELQDKGFKASDIAILVRKNREGVDVINSFINYKVKASLEKTAKYNYSIVSGESLLIGSSPAVAFILALLRFSIDPSDRLSKALMLRNWLIATGEKPEKTDLSDIDNDANELFPDGWMKFTENLKHMPVFEAVENSISFFRLGEPGENFAFLSAFQQSVFEYSLNNSSDIPSFLEWWNLYGADLSLTLSDRQESIRVITIHKAKGLEFKVVIVPFLNWTMTYEGNMTPIIWINPEKEPFNEINLVPVRYKKDMLLTLFANEYLYEKYCATIDNLNLLYVAFTRAKEVLIGFCPIKDKDKEEKKLGHVNKCLFASFLEKSVNQNGREPLIDLSMYFNRETCVFELGDLVKVTQHEKQIAEGGFTELKYNVNPNIPSLRIKFHGEGLFIKEGEKIEARLNYGKLMHEILASVITLDDIPAAVNRMVQEGRIDEGEKEEIEKRINSAVSSDEIMEWFRPGLKIVTEADILTTKGTIRRPDRVIISDDRAIVVDFKFGRERSEYKEQVALYRNLLLEMGYKQVDAYLWYVDQGKVVCVN